MAKTFTRRARFLAAFLLVAVGASLLTGCAVAPTDQNNVYDDDTRGGGE